MRISENPGAVGEAFRERGFSRSWQAAHEHQAGPQARRFKLGKSHQPVRTRARQGRRALDCGNLGLQQFHPFHLGPHDRPVRCVEGEQQPALRVARRPEIFIGERLGQVSTAATGEVHHQERHVGHRIRAAEPRSELNAVDDNHV